MTPLSLVGCRVFALLGFVFLQFWNLGQRVLFAESALERMSGLAL